jgi:hypothetical protein
MNDIVIVILEELDDRRELAEAFQQRKAIKMGRMGDQNILPRAPQCFGRHVRPLVPAAFAVVSTHSSFKEVDVYIST